MCVDVSLPILTMREKSSYNIQCKFLTHKSRTKINFSTYQIVLNLHTTILKYIGKKIHLKLFDNNSFEDQEPVLFFPYFISISFS